MKFSGLKELREKLLGYRRESVSRMSGISEKRLQDIEDKNKAPSVCELETLAGLYGVDAEVLGESSIRLKRDDSIGVLASLEEFRDVTDATKANIVGAANAARDLLTLRTMAGEEDPWDRFITEARGFERHDPRDRPYAAGSHYAKQLRRRFGLGERPIESFRDAVAFFFPSVSVLYAHLRSRDLAGITVADRRRGPAIIINLDGKNANPCVRRFSLAHELCHLLVDFNRREPLATLSGFLTEAGLEREQRANGFASRLLVPEKAVRKLAREHTALEAAKLLIERYGIHMEAARLYLKNVASEDVPRGESAHIVAGISEKWREAEEPAGMKQFPLEDVPAPRRTLVAEHASMMYSEGRITRTRFAEFLGVTPAHEVEKVLDFFGLDVPAGADRN